MGKLTDDKSEHVSEAGIGRRDFLARLYPQLMHIGVLLVMLGYLLTAWMGVREDVLLRPHSGDVVVQVFCIQQGRWHNPDMEFRKTYDELLDITHYYSRTPGPRGGVSRWAHFASIKEV